MGNVSIGFHGSRAESGPCAFENCGVKASLGCTHWILAGHLIVVSLLYSCLVQRVVSLINKNNVYFT